MKLLKYIVLHVVVLFFTTACSTHSISHGASGLINEEPIWLSNPYCDNDKYASVGCCGPHIDGEAAQKKIAISRAIDNLATQIKVKIDSTTIREEHGNELRHASKSATTSQQTVSNVEISTQIKAIYKKKNGEICVWAILK